MSDGILRPVIVCIQTTSTAYIALHRFEAIKEEE